MWMATTLGMVLWPLAQAVPVETPAQPVIVVEATSLPAVTTTPSAADARRESQTMAAAVSVVELERVREGAPPTLADSLSDVPGLYARSRNGSAQTRLSIRGSGLARNADTRGIALQLDGLPLNVADADFDFLNAIEPLTLSHVRVNRSANSADGVTQALGGSIDFITRTGRDLPRAEVRTESGSHGTFRQHVAGGWEGEKADAFAAWTHFATDGFREHSQQNRWHATANLGWGDRRSWENRIAYTGFESEEELPGALTMARIAGDRSQAASSANPDFDRVRADWRDTLAWHRVSDRFVWEEDGERVDGGVWFTTSSIRNPRNQVFDTDGWDTGARVRWRREGDWAGRPQIFSISLTGTAAANEETAYENRGSGRRGPVADDTSERSGQADVYLQHEMEFIEDWHWRTSLQLGWTQRTITDRFKGPGEKTTRDERNDHPIGPATGVVYAPSENWQAYVQAARAHESPTQADLYQTGAADYVRLASQHSVTVETGTRGTWGQFAWDAAFYHAWLENEYLITENIPGSTETRNTPRSIHRGIEAALAWDLLGKTDAAVGTGDEPSLTLNQQVLWNDFHLVNDPRFGDNRIAGIPEWILRTDVEFRHPSGFYLQPGVEVQPDGIPVDYANTLESDAFALFGLRAGYGKERGLRVFFEARNLTDETYVADVTVIADAAGNDARVFFPGSGRSFYGGLSWSW